MMKILTKLGIASALLCCTVQARDAAPHEQNQDRCSVKATKGQLNEHQDIVVTQVADGDTFTGCTTDGRNLKVKVRVLGMDCPESHYNDKCRRDGEEGRKNCDEQVPLGQKATLRAIELLGNHVKLESSLGTGNFDADDYKRILAYVRLDSQEDFGLTMIKEGQCEDFSWKYPHPRQDQYKNVGRH